MGFGKNPHVAKARAAEQKAVDARDDIARARAYRDAAHQWDRAAERERPGKQRDEYEREAAKNRALADGGADSEAGVAERDGPDHEGVEAAPLEYRLLN